MFDGTEEKDVFSGYRILGLLNLCTVIQVPDAFRVRLFFETLSEVE